MGMEKPADNQDKLSWCEWGDQQEMSFLARSWSAGIGVFRNPNKAGDRYAHDIFLVVPADLKTICTPFNTADRYGIDPGFAITINDKDIERYRKLGNAMVLILDVSYPHYQATHLAQLGQLIRATEIGKAKRHAYLHRVNDQSGNAKHSWVFDCRWFPKI